ncbi:restriction endonuclease S subunits [Serpentinimonas raichei]|uniref:Restriction endonuclease S subunits n=1 Tax=Serpentinimonas raichei TaxID=1458425 RepID=A0A060NN87_9BURK|nr:restriction endonuclease subunit S [Serpentinimonas raichei]BAO80998.1 restriction endonuclease S subunits [Serpentinimonas raichei]
MEVRPGYKLTEVGVIPDDWVVAAISQVAPLQRGFDLPARSIKPGPFPIVYSNGSEGFHNVAMVKGPGVATGRSGTLGKLHYIDSDYWPHNTSLWVTRFNENDPKFIYYLYHSLHFERFASGSGVPTLNRNDAHGHQIAVPRDRAEQRAIATALSDVDALLAGLERLIAKKRDLKQAAMQQLLTGQTRLPGFQGEWEVKRLGELGVTYGGLTGKTKADFGSGAARYVTFMNVMANTVIDHSTFEAVRVSLSENQNRVERGDLLFNGSSETPEEVALCALVQRDVHNLYLNSFCFGFRPRADAEVDGLFLTYYIRSSEGREIMKSLAQGSTRYNLSKKALLVAEVRVPTLPEQVAIVGTLSDMATELTALEARRDKTRALKQGMMQELLTGRTRLI